MRWREGADHPCLRPSRRKCSPASTFLVVADHLRLRPGRRKIWETKIRLPGADHPCLRPSRRNHGNHWLPVLGADHPCLRPSRRVETLVLIPGFVADHPRLRPRRRRNPPGQLSWRVADHPDCDSILGSGISEPRLRPSSSVGRNADSLPPITLERCQGSWRATQRETVPAPSEPGRGMSQRRTMRH